VGLCLPSLSIGLIEVEVGSLGPELCGFGWVCFSSEVFVESAGATIVPRVFAASLCLDLLESVAVGSRDLEPDNVENDSLVLSCDGEPEDCSFCCF